MNQNEFDAFMETALSATSKIISLQTARKDAMDTAGAVGDLYSGKTDEAGILKMAIAGTDGEYERANAEINAIYAKIEKAGITPAVQNICDFPDIS